MHRAGLARYLPSGPPKRTAANAAPSFGHLSRESRAPQRLLWRKHLASRVRVCFLMLAGDPDPRAAAAGVRIPLEQTEYQRLQRTARLRQQHRLSRLDAAFGRQGVPEVPSRPPDLLQARSVRRHPCGEKRVLGATPARRKKSRRIKHRFGDGDDLFVIGNVQGIPRVGPLDQDGALVGEVEGRASALGASRRNDGLDDVHLLNK